MPQQNKATELLRNVDIFSRVTGIGSVPFIDAEQANELILHYCPVIPYVPQLTKRDFREDMFLQFHENLPCLAVDYEKHRVLFDESLNKEKALIEFYDAVADNNVEHFKITPDYSRGFYAMLEKCREKSNPFVKSQITGPITYLLSVTRRDKRPLLYDDEFAEAMTLGLAMKCLWQAQEIRKIGKMPLLFFDEPSLMGLGSAFLPLSSERASVFVDNLISFIKERDKDILIGLHCCGNTDWSMILASKVDIVSFDAYGSGERLFLYPKEIMRFVDRGGFLAFGIVPTSEYKDEITEKDLYEHFVSLLGSLEEKDLPGAMLRSSLFTPSCGMGPLVDIKARRILELTTSLSRQIHHKWIKA